MGAFLIGIMVNSSLSSITSHHAHHGGEVGCGRSVAVARGQLSAECRTDGLVQRDKDIAVAGARGQQGLSAARHYRRWESGDDFNGHGRTDHPEV